MNLHKEINDLLKSFADIQVNLSSEHSRDLITNKIIDIIRHNKKDVTSCISCKKNVYYNSNIDVEERPFYVTGAGQLCIYCYTDLYGIKK